MCECVCVKGFQRAHWASQAGLVGLTASKLTQGWANPLQHENRQNSMLHSEALLPLSGKIKI